MKSLFVVALSILFFDASSQDTVRYTIRFGDRIAGFQKTWKSADGYWMDYYEFNDRGRGPAITTKFKLNDDGFPIFVEASGVNYLKGKVTEQFSLSNNVAMWRNESEHGERQLSSKAYYVPINGNAGSYLGPLSKSPSKTIDLLPAGKAILSLAKEFTFTLNEKPAKLILCGVTGIGLSPSYSWADASYNYVGDVGDWYSNVKDGYESLIPDMREAQKKESDNYFFGVSEKLIADREKLAIVNVKLFDSERATIVPGSTVLVEDGKITAVGKTGTLKVPSGFRTIDGSTKTLVPGMWDMHVHYTDATDGFLHLAAGVTSVRDMANSTSLLETRAKIDEGKLLGPRIAYICGFIDGAGPYAGPTGEIINSVEEGLKSVKKYADLGYQQIKLYSSIKPEWVAPLAAEARKFGMKVSGHIPAYMTASEAIDAGYNEIQHVNMLFLNFYGKDKDTRTPLRFRLVAENAASFDFESEEFRNFISKMKSNNIVSDPTVAIFEEMFTSEMGKPNPVYADIVDRLPASAQRSVQTFGGLPSDGKEEAFRKSYAACLKFVRAMYDAGITIVAGTDAMPGFAYHRELELYSKSGIPNNKVLQIATLNGARVAGREKDLGSIKVGKIADMIIVNGNPVENISDIRKVDIVIKEGRVFNSSDVYRAISVEPYR